jgi:hypothetical protein
LGKVIFGERAQSFSPLALALICRSANIRVS